MYGDVCPRWMKNMAWNNETTLQDLNGALMERNVLGISFLFASMILGIFGNTIVLLIFYFKYNPSNYRIYVLFLALMDIAMCFLTMPFSIVFMWFPLNFRSNFVCKGGLFLGYTFGIASSGALVLIAADRYRKICRPLKKQITIRQAKMTCIGIICGSLLCTWFTPLLYGTIKVPTGINGIIAKRCFLEVGTPYREIARGYYILLASLFLTISTLLSGLYFFIMKKVHFHSKSIYAKKNFGGSFVTTNKNIRTRKTTVTFFIITAVFILCSIPHHSLGIVLHFVDNLEMVMSFTGGQIFYLFYWTIFLNNIANPFIYGVSDDRFRTLLKQFVRNKEKDTSQKQSCKSITSVSQKEEQVGDKVEATVESDIKTVEQ